MKSRRPKRRRAKNRRRRARENTRKNKRAVTARVTPPIAVAAVAVVVIVAQILTVMASSRAKRERRTRKKIPVGITARRASTESRVKRPPLIGAGHEALTPDTSGLRRSPEITDKQGQRGDGAGVDIAARRTSPRRREVKREGDTTAGTGRDLAAPSLPQTEVGAVREAGRTEVKTGVAAEMVRRTEVAQMEGEAEQQMGGAEAGKGEGRERAGEGAGAERGERGAKTERKENTDLQYWTELVKCFVSLQS